MLAAKDQLESELLRVQGVWNVGMCSQCGFIPDLVVRLHTLTRWGGAELLGYRELLQVGYPERPADVSRQYLDIKNNVEYCRHP